MANKCYCCGTSLIDINEPCPNCLPKMAWRSPTMAGHPSTMPEPEPSKQFCCEADYHCRGFSSAAMRRSHVAMLILENYADYDTHDEKTEICLYIKDKKGRFGVGSIPINEIPFKSWTSAIINTAKEVWPDMPELRLLND